jgi:hypothetical protein
METVVSGAPARVSFLLQEERLIVTGGEAVLELHAVRFCRYPQAPLLRFGCLP